MSDRTWLGPKPRLFLAAALVLVALIGRWSDDVGAQGREGSPVVPTSPKAVAAIDLVGNWVSVVTEDWRFRMVTPRKGDYASVPMTNEARKVAETWDLSKDGSCLAYGAAGLMRMPARLRVTWESDTVLKIETDAGMQVRRFLFNPAERPGPRTLQGFSVAEWEGVVRGRGATGAGGSLKVVTTNMSGGWVRKNGVPYSEEAVLTEYFDRFTAPEGEEWFTVTTIVDDLAVLHAAICDQHPLQEGIERIEVESVALPRDNVSERPNRLLAAGFRASLQEVYMRVLRIGSYILLLGIVTLASAYAQDVASGSVAGTVRDTSGAVLPGATVEAESPALIEKVRTTSTDNEGRYRINGLRPGVYSITFTLPGFGTARREGVELTTGFVATINGELSVSALEETVTVTGTAPLVDVKSSSQQAVYAGATLRELPLGKNSGSYAALLPGAVLNNLGSVDVGGTKGETENNIAIHGGLYARRADIPRWQL